MKMRRFLLVVVAMVVSGAVAGPAWGFAGGTGEPNDPYQIATADQLTSIGSDPNLLSKHFVLVADIDLDPNLPGGRIFEKAVIAPLEWPFPGTPFSGVFDGRGHKISHLTICGRSSWLSMLGEFLGLFGRLEFGAVVKDLGVVDVNITSSSYVGALVGRNSGRVTGCYSTGSIGGGERLGGLVGYNRYGIISNSHSTCSVSATSADVGGLVGYNRDGTISNCYSTGAASGAGSIGGLVGWNDGTISCSYSTGSVTGTNCVGGLVGYHQMATISNCYSTGSVSGKTRVGGLAGQSHGTFISNSYSTGPVTGTSRVGGLVGYNSQRASVMNSYSTGWVSGTDTSVGGLVGENDGGSFPNSFWDTTTSGRSTSAGGTGLTTNQMQDSKTFLDTGWDLVGERSNGICDIWLISPGAEYPKLSAFKGHAPAALAGSGTTNDPYVVEKSEDLRAVAHCPEACYRLASDLDLSGMVWSTPVIAVLSGSFDGQGHRISHMTIRGSSFLGLFGYLARSRVSELALENVSVVGAGPSAYVGGLVACNYGGSVSDSYSTGSVSAASSTGSWGAIGGLVGYDDDGTVSNCYSTCSVTGNSGVGGLVGRTSGGSFLNNSYSTGPVTGSSNVGGLVGYMYYGSIENSYSTGQVSGKTSSAGGLVGYSHSGTVCRSFWDKVTSGRDTSAAGTGLTTSEMQDAKTFLEAGWDLLGERGNGTSETWLIPTGGGCPKLSVFNGYVPQTLDGSGTTNDPYIVKTAEDLGAVGHRPTACYRLGSDVDLSGIVWSQGVIPIFSGSFDGGGHRIRNMTISGGADVGLFGSLGLGAIVSDLGLESVNVVGMGWHVGGLSGNNDGSILNCYCTGSIIASDVMGGLVGDNGYGTVSHCYSTASVKATGAAPTGSVGGLIGRNEGHMSGSYSTGSVSGADYVGGLVGMNGGTVLACYSTGSVRGINNVGGLVGDNGAGYVSDSYSIGPVSGQRSVGGLVGAGSSNVFYSVWDTSTSGVSASAGGVGLTTAEMMDPNWLGQNGFADNSNWVLDPGRDYPKLAWQNTSGRPVAQPTVNWLEGYGTAEAPYRICTADQLIIVSKASSLWNSDFVLCADIDLDPNLPDIPIFGHSLIQILGGVFDGNDHTISHLAIQGLGCLGLFGQSVSGAKVKNLGVVDVNIAGSDDNTGGLLGCNRGDVSNCYCTGSVAVTGQFCRSLGGLVGLNHYGASVSRSYSTGSVTGSGTGSGTYIAELGGLVGLNYGSISNSYSTSQVGGADSYYVGGLVGMNYGGLLSNTYSSGSVKGKSNTGGLVGASENGTILKSFWDTTTSGRTTSDGGMGLSTAQMKNINTYLAAGWDFIDEVVNGLEDIWKMPAAGGYPLLFWHGGKGAAIPQVYPTPGLEGFETGNFSAFAWERSGDSRWFVTSGEQHSGSYSARAGDIGDEQTSTLTLTRKCSVGKISFFVKTSCEAWFDELVFRIDGEVMGEWSGIGAWTEVFHSVTAGTHSFEWIYIKDDTSSKGEDTAWLDDITFPAE
jgi:hypothetical protein